MPTRRRRGAPQWHARRCWAGDLVFFGTKSNIHHVGIYAGNGMLIDSPHTGAAVEVGPRTTYPDYFSAGRVLFP
jgi:cell wall-associated NlpC family hydrolase